MDSKKYPGKFTVRFNLADPQQQEAVRLLNQQGRFKAQFLTNAVLHYMQGGQISSVQDTATITKKQIERVGLDILAQQSDSISEKDSECPVELERADKLSDADRNSIFSTLDAFQQK